MFLFFAQPGQLCSMFFLGFGQSSRCYNLCTVWKTDARGKISVRCFHERLSSQHAKFPGYWIWIWKISNAMSVYLPLDQLIFVIHSLKIWKSMRNASDLIGLVTCMFFGNTFKVNLITIWDCLCNSFPADSCYSPTVFGDPIYFSTQTALDEECQICDFWWGKRSSYRSFASQPVKVCWTYIQFPWDLLFNLED